MHDPNIESYEAFIERMAGADLPKEDTVRSHLKAQERLAYQAESGKTLVWGDNPDDYFRTLDRILREIQEHAVAALAILDNADTMTSPWNHKQYRQIPDPVGVVSPRPNQQETP